MVAQGAITASLAVEAVKELGEIDAVEEIKIAIEKANSKGERKVTKRHVEKLSNKPNSQLSDMIEKLANYIDTIEVEDQKEIIENFSNVLSIATGLKP